MAVLLVAADARADTHGSVGVGSTTFVDTWNFGVWGGAALQFGKRWGVRGDVYTPQNFDAVIAETSATYQLASARPHLVITGFFGAGLAAPHPAATLDAGLSTQLEILKHGKIPIAIELLLSVHVVTDRAPLDTTITSVLGIDFAW